MKWFLSLCLVYSFSVLAQEEGESISGDMPDRQIDSVDRNYQEMARKRNYPGGRDEEDLKVQPVLPTIQRKMDMKGVQAQVFKGKIKVDMESEQEAPRDSFEE